MFKLNKQLLKKMVDEKYVAVTKHPTADLFIYNYTNQCQYEKYWNEITLMCRGLILDADMNVVAKPFGKFFNIEEHKAEEIPNLPFDVWEKLDGSLGILYWVDCKPYIATRGSFISDQAIHATKVLYDKYEYLFDKLDRGSTYLFEIIFEQNRVVIDYSDLDDIILLTIIDNETGDERIEDIGFPIVKQYHGITDLSKLREVEEDNKEGFVIRFSNGFRVKAKYAEYVRLHRIITGVSSKTIWEHLSDGKPFDELLDKVPDEFYNWVKKTKDELVNKFNEILNENKKVFKEFDTRKETAMYFQTQKYPTVLFQMLDGKTPDKVIWKMIKPAFSKPFKNDVE